jgi:dUTP pyrophosphatase
MKTLKVKKLSDKAILPTRSHEFDAGLDVYAAEDCFIPVGGTVKIPTHISVNIEPGYWGLICDRSGMAAKGLRTGAGVIDHGFTGHMCVVIHNLNNIQDEIRITTFQLWNGWFKIFTITHGYQVKAGDRVAQLVIQPVSLPTVEEVDELPPTDRGDKGFGSSGQ